MKKSILRNAMLSILFTTACSCTSDTVYHRYKPTCNEGWMREDTISFILPDSMKTGVYTTEIGIRHTVTYPYKDIWLTMIMSGKEKADTIHIYLANDRGNWNSNGSTGGYFQYSMPSSDFRYSSACDSVIKISHIMKDSPLYGITDIGLKITEK